MINAETKNTPPPSQAAALEAPPRSESAEAAVRPLRPAATAGVARLREDLIHPDPLLDCLVEICRLQGVAATRASLAAGLPIEPERHARLTVELAERAASRAGMVARVQRVPLAQLDATALPAILLLAGDDACVLLGWGDDGQSARVLLSTTGQGSVLLTKDELARRYSGVAMFVRPHFRFDSRTPQVRESKSGHWFWGAVLEQRGVYRDVLWAALLVNIFALAFPLFSMNVYDRVVPNNAIETLWALTVGVLLVLGADLFMRLLRSHFVDEASARIDIRLSAALMEKVLGMRLETRPESVGSFASNLRGFEQVRDFIASGTVTALIDLPFALLFIGVLAWISPWLALPVVVAFTLILLLGYVLQHRLHDLAETTYKASAQRNATLIESLTGIETIKAQGAEGVIQAKWERTNGFLARTNVKMRALSASAMYSTNTLSQLVWVVLILIGVYLISQRELTMGALIAASMLSSRALAPASQIIGLLMQYQGARTALESLNQIMAQPVERAAGQTFIQRPQLRGDIEFRGVRFSYPEPQGQRARRHQLQDRRRRARGADRSGRFGQVDDPAADHGHVRTHRRRGADRRHRPSPARPGGRAPQHRQRVAGRDAVLRHVAREHHLRPALRRRLRLSSPRPRSPDWPTSSTAIRAASTCRSASAANCFPAASVRASVSPARCCTTRRSCCSTSRPAPWTSRPRPRSPARSPRLRRTRPSCW